MEKQLKGEIFNKILSSINLFIEKYPQIKQFADAL